MTLSPITKTVNVIISKEDYNELSGRISQPEVSQVSGRKRHHEDILSGRKKSSSSSLSALKARTASTVRLSMISEASDPDDKCLGKAYLLERKQEVNLAPGYSYCKDYKILKICKSDKCNRLVSEMRGN